MERFAQKPGFESRRLLFVLSSNKRQESTRGGDRGFDLFTLFVYFTQLLPSGGAFLAEVAGQENGRKTIIGLNGR